LLVIDAGKLRHGLDDYLDFANLGVANVLVYYGEIVPDRVFDVGQRLLLGLALRPTAWKTGYPNAEAFVSVLERDFVLHLL